MKKLDDMIEGVTVAAPAHATGNGAALDIEEDTPEKIAAALSVIANHPPSRLGDHGDNNTYNLFCAVRDEGVSEATALNLVAEHYNVEPRCDPIWTIEELTTKARNAYAYAKGSLGAKSAEADFSEPVEPDPVIDAAQAKHDAAKAAEAPEAAKRQSRFKAHSLSTLMRRPDPVWMVPDMIPEGLSLLYGKPKSGKTFWALDVSLSIASGADFHGVKIGKHGRVCYIAAEGGGKAVASRVVRMIKQRKLPVEQGQLAYRNVKVVEWGVPLNDPKSVAEFLAENPGEWCFMVFDTLARSMKGDENSAKDVNAVIAGVDHIRNVAKCDAMILHHEGRASGHLRGSTALEGAPDAILRAVRDEANIIEIKAEQLREGVDGTTMLFRLSDGVLVTVKARNELRAREAKMHDALVALVAAAEGAPILVSHWRKAVENLGGILSGEDDARKKQFQRAVEYMATKAKTIKLSGDKRARKAVPLANEAAISEDFDNSGGEDFDGDNPDD